MSYFDFAPSARSCESGRSSLQPWQLLAEAPCIEDVRELASFKGSEQPVPEWKQRSDAEACRRIEHGSVQKVVDDLKVKWRGKKVFVENPRTGVTAKRSGMLGEESPDWVLHHQENAKATSARGRRSSAYSEHQAQPRSPRDTRSPESGGYAGAFTGAGGGKKIYGEKQHRTSVGPVGGLTQAEISQLQSGQLNVCRRPQKQVLDEDTHERVNLHKVSKNGPDFMKEVGQKLDDDAYRQRCRNVATVNGTPSRARNAGLRNDSDKYQKDHRGKKTQIKQESGHLLNQTIVSVSSPDWMKKPFEDNRAYFEKLGVAQKVQEKPMMKTNESEFDHWRHPAGIRNSLQERDVKSKLQHKIVNDDNNKVFTKQMESRGETPEWMDSAFENNKAAYEDKGLVPNVSPRKWKAAGVDQGIPFRGKKAIVTHQDTGKVQHRSVNSPTTPEWMKLGAIGHEHFMKKGEEMQKLTGRLLDADDEHEIDVSQGLSRDGIRVLTECASTGKTALGEKFCHSNQAPAWMMSPLLHSRGSPLPCEQSREFIDQPGVQDPHAVPHTSSRSSRSSKCRSSSGSKVRKSEKFKQSAKRSHSSSRHSYGISYTSGSSRSSNRSSSTCTSGHSRSTNSSYMSYDSWASQSRDR